MGNPLLFELFSPCSKDVISFALLSRFSLSSFQKIDCDVSCCAFEFSYSKFTQLLEFVGLRLLTNLGHFCCYFFVYFFIPVLFLLFLWDCDDRSISSFVIVPQVPEVLFVFLFSVYFISVVQLDNFYFSIFQFTDFSSTPSILLLNASIEFLEFLLYFSVLKFPFGSFSCLLFLAKTFYFFNEGFYFFHVFQVYLLNHFYYDHFKIFVRWC